MKKVVIATNNKNKAKEISAALNLEGWQFFTLHELGLVSDPEENANTFEGNARIKAQAAHKISGGLAALADDSGLEVDALEGAPGVYSARYAGRDATDAQNNEKLLAELAEVPNDKRSARFVCTLVFIDENGKERIAQGCVEGFIGHEEHGSNGFGYDPLFFPCAFKGEKSFAQVSQEEKTLISHRGEALRALRAQLES